MSLKFSFLQGRMQTSLYLSFSTRSQAGLRGICHQQFQLLIKHGKEMMNEKKKEGPSNERKNNDHVTHLSEAETPGAWCLHTPPVCSFSITQHSRHIRQHQGKGQGTNLSITSPEGHRMPPSQLGELASLHTLAHGFSPSADHRRKKPGEKCSAPSPICPLPSLPTSTQADPGPNF